MRAQRGFSVVELMVAMTISLMLLAGGLSVMYTSRITFDENVRVARLQDFARSSMELIMSDLRSAGSLGCARAVESSRFRNSLTAPAALRYNFGLAVQGFEGSSGTWSPALDATVIPSAATVSDILVVRTPSPDLPVFLTRTAFAGGTGSISIKKRVGVGLPAGTALLVSDCDYANVFTNSAAVATAGTTGTLERATGAITAPSGAVEMPQNSAVSFPAYAVNSSVTVIETVVYYVRPSSSASGPSLWRIVGNGAPQELVEGVERLEIQYGEDTNNDQLVDTYRTAAAVANWANVLSVSLAVLLRAPEQDPDSMLVSRTFDMLGTTVGPFEDRRARVLFTTTVALRNRATAI
jgi:type IV pilus assembly protein PilW